MRVDGRKYEVIGVFFEKKSGFDGPYDSMALIPSGAFTDTYGLVFCTLVDITFGLLPAIKAAKLNPINALFYLS